MIFDLRNKDYPFKITMSVSGLSDKANECDVAISVLKATQIYYPGSHYDWFRPVDAEPLLLINPESKFKFVRIFIEGDFYPRTIEAIFSRELNHIDVMHALIDTAFEYCHDIGYCIAAGFVEDGCYYGRSESIGIDCEGND